MRRTWSTSSRPKATIRSSSNWWPTTREDSYRTATPQPRSPAPASILKKRSSCKKRFSRRRRPRAVTFSKSPTKTEYWLRNEELLTGALLLRVVREYRPARRRAVSVKSTSAKESVLSGADCQAGMCWCHTRGRSANMRSCSMEFCDYSWSAPLRPV